MTGRMDCKELDLILLKSRGALPLKLYTEIDMYADLFSLTHISPHSR
jgi:hypothetical protein